MEEVEVFIGKDLLHVTHGSIFRQGYYLYNRKVIVELRSGKKIVFSTNDGDWTLFIASDINIYQNDGKHTWAKADVEAVHIEEHRQTREEFEAALYRDEG